MSKEEYKPRQKPDLDPETKASLLNEIVCLINVLNLKDKTGSVTSA